MNLNFKSAWIYFIGYFTFNYIHGYQLSVNYVYHYLTNIKFDDQLKFGLNFEYHFEIEKVWQSLNQSAFKVKLSQDNYNLFIFYHFKNDKILFKEFYVQGEDNLKKVNIKKAISTLIEIIKPEKSNGIQFVKTNNELTKHYFYSNVNISKSLLIPNFSNEWQIKNKFDDENVTIESKGWQNVSFNSRVNLETQLNANLNYSLKLVKTYLDKNNQLEAKKNLSEILQTIGTGYIKHDFKMAKNHEPSKKSACSIKYLTKENLTKLVSHKVGTSKMFEFYLNMLFHLKADCSKNLKHDTLDLLKAYSSDQHSLSILLDLISSSNQIDSIEAAFRFLDLNLNDELDLSERFLITLSASYITQSQSKKSILNIIFIINKLMTLVRSDNWNSMKLKYSTAATLSTFLQIYNSLHSDIKILNGKLNQGVIEIIFNCLEKCDDSDCRITILNVIENAANFFLTFDHLVKIALNAKQKYESIAALRAIHKSLKYILNYVDDQNHTHQINLHLLNFKTIKKLRSVIEQIIFDPKYVATAKLVAINIVNDIQDKALLESIVRNLDKFKNFELTTLIWNMFLSKQPYLVRKTNWLDHLNFFNGSSTALRNDMIISKKLNLSFLISMELFGREKLLRESSFEFQLNDGQNLSQHIFSVQLFARGFEYFTGDNIEEENYETTSAGMVLKILDFKLRPYIFFNGKSELFGHIWSNTAGSPLTAFSANLLINDWNKNIELINGFILNQNLIGVLSFEVTGEAQVFFWNRNLQTNVKTQGSVVFRGTSRVDGVVENQSLIKEFEMTAETSFDMQTDVTFNTVPIHCCFQMTQSEIIINFSNKTIKMINTEKSFVHSHKSVFRLPGKSFLINSENNQMCASLFANT